MNDTPKYPGAAIGVIIWNGNKVLLGKRKGELGPGQYSVPGGKIDFGETPFEAALREVKEETNIDVKSLMFTGHVTNDWFPDKQKHFICMYYMGIADDPSQLKVMEPTKIEGWDWYDIDNLPEPMWMHTGQLLAGFRERLPIRLKTGDIDGPQWFNL